MHDEIVEGARVKHPKMNEWGLGQVVSVAAPIVTVFFEEVGEKKIRTDFIELIPVDGVEAESHALDNKFRKKRTSKRAFQGAEYFNDGVPASRKNFIEGLGGTCANWYWSWSFVNHDEKKIFFGAWQESTKGNRSLIFSARWKTKYGKKRPSWPESRENLRLIEEESYSLYVYTMIQDPSTESDNENDTRKIGAILNDLTEAKLSREGDEWYAVFAEENPSSSNRETGTAVGPL